MNTAHTIFKLCNSLVWLLLAAFVGLLILTSIPQLPITGLAYRTYVITSGSMEPTIMTGDVIFSKAQPSYAVSDIITFQQPGDPTITHRITAVSDDADDLYTTKGDNNEDADPDPVALEHVLGKYQFRIPQLGYLLVYSKTPLGLIILFGTPLILYLIEASFFSHQPAKKVQSTPRSSSPNES